MRILDFDNTVYNGESVLDFYFFSLKKHPGVIKYLFPVIINFFKYKTGRITLSDLEHVGRKYAERYAREIPDIDSVVNAFWDQNLRKMKSWYIPENDDVIITASFNIIMDELCRRLHIKNCICSVMNRQNYHVEYINFNTNKKAIFEKTFGTDAVIDSFYTDSMLDAPLINISKTAYLVRGNKIRRVK